MRKNLVSAIVVTRNRKQDLIRCIGSLSHSEYNQLEMIVVDNASFAPVSTWLNRQYPRVKVITSNKNLGAAGGRNLGFKFAKGETFLFMDDDSLADRTMVGELAKILKGRKDVGIVQPKIYDMERKNVLQGIGCDINLLTGRVSAVGIREKDLGQYDRLIEISGVGCIWMVERKVIEKIGGYDEDYFIPYEDLDFSFRARMAGFKILFVPTARAWHKGIKSTFISPLIDYIGIRNKERAYRVSRNKIIFMRKNAPLLNFLIFIFVINPIYLLVHSILISLTGRFDVLVKYWLGFISGIWYAVKYENLILKLYNDIDKQLIGFKYHLMVWTDPICWVIDKSAKNILDVGSGLGIPMELIRRRMKVQYAVGIDKFRPYIDYLKSKKVHDKYILGDVRKMRFRAKSFDVVFASDLIEHLPKKDSWKLIENMERIAKRQVIVTTSLGYFFHPAVDGNPLQLHKSGFHPQEFEIKGYKTFKYGRKEILGTNGWVHTINFDSLKKLLFLVNSLFFPLFIIFPNFGNYCFIAYKNTENNKYN
ncbi:glycosyltransferase [Candidatus Daviesbacteria bacterium]|nr:glycosyltransferase [Candidatus Daviesbacteria bacterium]